MGRINRLTDFIPPVPHHAKGATAYNTPYLVTRLLRCSWLVWLCLASPPTNEQVSAPPTPTPRNRHAKNSHPSKAKPHDPRIRTLVTHHSDGHVCHIILFAVVGFWKFITMFHVAAAGAHTRTLLDLLDMTPDIRSYETARLPLTGPVRSADGRDGSSLPYLRQIC